MNKTLKPIIFSDNVTSQITFFRNENGATKTILMLPALGVKASYYDSFCEYFADNDYNMVSMDWRGLGHSSVRASRKIDFGYKNFLNDIGEVVQLIQTELPNTNLYFAGHSLGGQLGALYLSRFPKTAKGLFAIACCSIYYKGWTGKERLPILAAGALFAPISNVVGYLPGKQLGFGGKEFRGVIKDWLYTLKTGKYATKGDDFDYELAMSKATFSILAISIEHDFMSPYKAVENLLAKFPNASTKHIQIPNTDKKLNHFRWTKIPQTILEKIDSVDD
jgi:predicted alpha/beta hydrolase